MINGKTRLLNFQILIATSYLSNSGFWIFKISILKEDAAWPRALRLSNPDATVATLQPSFSSSVVVSESQLCWNHQHQLIELASLWKESWNMSALKILWIQRLQWMVKVETQEQISRIQENLESWALSRSWLASTTKYNEVGFIILGRMPASEIHMSSINDLFLLILCSMESTATFEHCLCFFPL